LIKKIKKSEEKFKKGIDKAAFLCYNSIRRFGHGTLMNVGV